MNNYPTYLPAGSEPEELCSPCAGITRPIAGKGRDDTTGSAVTCTAATIWTRTPGRRVPVIIASRRCHRYGHRGMNFAGDLRRFTLAANCGYGDAALREVATANEIECRADTPRTLWCKFLRHLRKRRHPHRHLCRAHSRHGPDFEQAPVFAGSLLLLLMSLLMLSNRLVADDAARALDPRC